MLYFLTPSHSSCFYCLTLLSCLKTRRAALPGGPSAPPQLRGSRGSGAGARAAEVTGGSEALPSGISPQRRAWRQHAARFASPVRSCGRAEQLLR